MKKKILIFLVAPICFFGISSYGYPNMFKLSLTCSFENETNDNYNMKNHTFLTIENTGSWPTTFLGLSLNPGSNFTLSTYLQGFYSGRFIVNGDANFYNTDENLLGANKAYTFLFLDESSGQSLSTYIFSLFNGDYSFYTNSSLCCAHIWNYACNIGGQTSKLLPTFPVNNDDGYSIYKKPFSLGPNINAYAGGSNQVDLFGSNTYRRVRTSNQGWVIF